jgi:hypothetical protein
MDKTILKVIADNPSLFETLKRHILDEFEIEAPQADLGVTDEVLGQIFRARLVGKNKVESAFRKVMNYKTIESEEEKRNLAR